MGKAANGAKTTTYDPTADADYMSPDMLEYFREALLAWKTDIVAENQATVNNLKVENVSYPDPADTAAANADRRMELRARDRQRKVVAKIDQALRRIEAGEYGYCDHTGEAIGVRRLIARPIATLSIEAQEAHERGEKMRAN